MCFAAQVSSVCLVCLFLIHSRLLPLPDSVHPRVSCAHIVGLQIANHTGQAEFEEELFVDFGDAPEGEESFDAAVAKADSAFVSTTYFDAEEGYDPLQPFYFDHCDIVFPSLCTRLMCAWPCAFCVPLKLAHIQDSILLSPR